MAEMSVYHQIQDLLDCTSKEEIENRGRGGSVCGKAANLDRDHAQAAMRLKRKYICETPTYDDATFKRRYRVSRKIFARVFSVVLENGDYFVQKRYACGRLEICSDLKGSAAFWILAYGISFDAVDKSL